MFDVFISYSSAEKEIAEKVCDLLELEAVPCWIAPRDVTPGSFWPASIVQAVKNAKVMVLLFSKNSNNSDEVSREVTLAASNKLIIIPIKISKGRPSDSMEYYLTNTHWLDATSMPLEQAVSNAVAVIKAVLKIEPSSIKAKENIISTSALSNSDLIDIYDEQMDTLGTAHRSDVHTNGTWHKTFHCWFMGDESGKHYIFVQQRSIDKADFPLMLDISAARHLLAGESDREGIEKINKELGVNVNFEDVKYLGIRIYAEKKGRFFNREFNSVYLYQSPYLLNDFMPNIREVEGVIKILVEDGLALFNHEKPEITAYGKFFNDGTWKNEMRRVKISDFVPRVDNYYLKIFIAAQQFFAGSKYLSI